MVTAVDDAHVMTAEAYVLFYAKSDEQAARLRQQLLNVDEQRARAVTRVSCWPCVRQHC